MLPEGDTYRSRWWTIQSGQKPLLATQLSTFERSRKKLPPAWARTSAPLMPASLRALALQQLVDELDVEHPLDATLGVDHRPDRQRAEQQLAQHVAHGLVAPTVRTG